MPSGGPARLAEAPCVDAAALADGADAGARRVAAIAPVLGRQDQLLLRVVEVAFGPPKVGAALDSDQLLRRQTGALLGFVECRPVLRELVAAVLGCIDAHARRVDGDAARVAEPGDEAPGGEEPRSRPLGPVAQVAAPGRDPRPRL